MNGNGEVPLFKYYTKEFQVMEILNNFVSLLAFFVASRYLVRMCSKFGSLFELVQHFILLGYFVLTATNCINCNVLY